MLCPREFRPEKSEQVGAVFDISPCLAREIVYENDEQFDNHTPEQRWQHMRNWVESKIRSDLPLAA